MSHKQLNKTCSFKPVLEPIIQVQVFNKEASSFRENFSDAIAMKQGDLFSGMTSKDLMSCSLCWLCSDSITNSKIMESGVEFLFLYVIGVSGMFV